MKQVIIVGAGAAGIRTAHNLSKKGIKVILLEGSNTHGGRLKHAKINDEVVELGANWITGLSGPLWALAKSHKVIKNENEKFLKQSYKTDKVYEDFDDLPICVSEDGKDFTDEYNHAGNELQQKYNELMKKYQHQSFCYGTSIREALAELDALPKSFIEELVLWEECDLVEGVNNDKVSCFHCLDSFQSDHPEEEVFVRDQRGFRHILSTLLSELLEIQKQISGENETTLFLYQIAVYITYENDQVIVRTRKGSEFKADAVVLTVSLGVLSSSLIQFDPPMPSWKREALDQMGMCNYAKIYATFSKPFWGKSRYFFIATSTPGYFSWWVSIATHKNQDCYILLTSLVGEQAKLVSRLENEEIKVQIQSLLSNAFPKLCQKYDKSLFLPTSILYNRWEDDELFQGAYSYVKCKAFAEKEKAKAFYKPLQNKEREPVVYFSGEAFEKEGDIGYVHSALLSADDVSKQIYQRFRRKK